MAFDCPVTGGESGAIAGTLTAIVGATEIGIADAMAFAELSGLDLEKTRQMILGGTGKSGAMESLAPKALDGDYKEEADAIAAGLDWSQYRPEEHGAHEDGCGCGDAGDAEERRRARHNGAADRQLISVTDDSKGAGKHAKK